VNEPGLTLFVDSLWISPYALSAFVALEEKGLPYSVQEIDLSVRAQDEAAFQAASLTGRVPVLVRGDFHLSESQAIGEYLAENFPYPKFPRLFPENLDNRGRARQLMSWIRSDLMPIRVERSTTTMFYERARTPLSADGKKAAARVLNVASALVGDGRPYLFNSGWCLADADFGFFLMRLVLNGDEVPHAVKAYAERQYARASMQKFISKKRAPYKPYV
jgi:glutathione S-transferase